MQIKRTILTTIMIVVIYNPAAAHEFAEPAEYRWNESLASGYRDTDHDGVSDYRDVCLRTPKGVRVTQNGCPSPEGELSFAEAGAVSKCTSGHFHYGGVRSPYATISPGGNAARRQKEYDLVLSDCVDKEAAGKVLQYGNLSTMGLWGRTDDNK